MSSLKCRIIYKKGVATVVNLDGTPSELYQEALALTGSQDQALKIWSTAYSEVFATEYGVNYRDQYKLDDVLTFLDTHDSLGKRLDAQQRSQVVSLMQTSGIERLSDLSNTLNRIFKKNGILELDPKTALRSKLYTEEDLKDFDIESVRDILEAIDGELVTNDIETTPQDKTSLYDSSKKTVLGTSEKVTIQEIENSLLDAIDDFSNEKEVDAAINASPYSEAVTKELRDKLLSYTRVPVVSILDGELTTDNLDTYTTVSNTLTTEYSSKAINRLEANVRYFSSLSEEVLTEKRDTVVKVLKEVEQEHAEIGIDLVGLSRFPNKVKDMLPLLESAITMLEFPTEANVRKFSALKDSLITPRKNSVATIVKPAYKGLTVVRLDTNIPLETLYREHQLIKIGENLFHKVSSENTADDLSEALYNKVLDGGLKISTIEDYKLPENKVQVLKDIRKHVLKQQVPGYTNSKEMVVLHQLVFEHLPIKADPRAIDRIGEVTSDINYLKDDFVADFYRMILVEKAKDSTLYRTKLSAFAITDNDISLHRQIDNLDGILMQKELEDYIRIKKDSEMNHLLPASKRFRNGALEAINNPDQVKEYNKPTRNIEEFIVTEPNDKDFIKVNGELYRQLVKDSNASVFAKVEIEPGSYYQTDANKYFNLEDARKALDDSTGMFTPQETTKEDHEQYKKEVGVELKEAPKKSTDKQTTQLVAEYLKGKLGMGISILSNSDMRTELAKRGYDSSNNTSTEGTLLTANDKVYGFYDGTTGGIYLTEDFLNSGTLVHEHWHAFKPALKAKASKGDKTAQMLLDKMTSIVDESGVFNEAEFSARYDAANNKFTEWSNPKVKREALNAKIKQAAQELKAGKITNEAFREIVKENSTVAPITEFVDPATEEQMNVALASNKLPKLGAPVEQGKLVGLRLDIPALDNHNTWVVTVHEAKSAKDKGSSPISYTNVARITNVSFNTDPKRSLDIATGENKNNFIRMNGNWSDIPGESFEDKGQNAKQLVEDIKNNPEWIQVGANPYRHSYFYDRSNEMPVTNAEEVIQIGGLVYAKNVTYGDINSPEFTVKGLKDAAGNPVQFSIIGEEGAAALDRFEEASIRLDDLAVARDMEAAGKTKNEIRTATGWERGIEGLWRYEILDLDIDNSVFDKLEESKIFNKRDYKLSDILGNHELFKAYPELKDIKLRIDSPLFDPFERTQGWYSSSQDVIAITPYAENKYSTLMHEIQHVIQDLEGFAQGGNDETAKKLISDEELAKILKDKAKTIDEKISKLESDLAYVEELKSERDKHLPTLQKLAAKYKDLGIEANKAPYGPLFESITKEREEVKNDFKDYLSTNNLERFFGKLGADAVRAPDSMPDFFGDYTLIRLLKPSAMSRAVESLKGLLEDKAALNSSNKEDLLKLIDADTSYSIYKRLAGEVESRNVQERLGMSQEERLAYLLTDTEDVLPEDQIILRNNIVNLSAENAAYHGGDLSMGIDGPLFVSEDRNQAEAYAEGNNGSIQKFNLNNLNIANEEDLIKILKDNEFTPAEGWTFDELNIHEILDPNFSDTSLSKPELDRLYEILSLKGIDAVRFTDSNLQTLKQDISNIVVFNTDKLSNVKMSTTLSSEAYNPRSGESKEDYIDRMREEIEANLLGAQGEEYFKRIAEENNLTEEQAKTFLGKIKDFIKQFSEWLSNQLGFNNLTPEQAANLTTKDAMDRIITTMLRNDTGAKKAVLDEKLKGFIALEAIGFKFVKPFEQKDIDNISCD